MAIDRRLRDAVADALSAPGRYAEAMLVVAYMERFRDLNQHNGEVLAEIEHLIDAIHPTVEYVPDLEPVEEGAEVEDEAEDE